MKTIKIFLASSEELRQERLELADLVEHLNNTLERRDITIRLVKWEYLDSSMGPKHKQEEYNEKLRECEMCLVLYWTRFGMYTKTELDTAYKELCEGRNPHKLYIYFKEGGDITDELKSFRNDFPNQYGHFYCTFQNIDTLKADFLLQFLEYQSQHLGGDKVVEVRNSQVIIDGKTYVDLKNVPFAGNNEDYNNVLKLIKKNRKLMAVKEPDNPEYAEYAAEVQELLKKQQAMEDSLWDTDLMITRLSTTHCSERMERAMDLFTKGDNKGAQAVLNEAEIERDVQHNLNLIKEAKKVLEINIEEYRFLIKTIENEQSEGWGDKVIKLHKKIIGLTSSLYGEHSLEVADALTDAIKVYSILKKYHEHIQASERAYKIRRSLLGEENQKTAESLAEIGMAYYHLCEANKTNNYIRKAIECGEKALSIRLKLFGPEHIDTAKSWSDLGCFYQYVPNYYPKALDALRKALVIFEQKNGEKSFKTAETYNDIGSVCILLGLYQDALECLIKAIEITTDIGEAEESKTSLAYELDSLTALVYENKGYCFYKQACFREALSDYLCALNIRRKTFGYAHSDTIRLCELISDVYFELGDNTKAQEYSQKAEKSKNCIGSQ